MSSIEDDADDGELGYWATRVEAILHRTDPADPATLLTEVANLASEMGDDTGERLFERRPDLPRNLPALRDAHDQHILQIEREESVRLLKSDLTDGRYVDLAGPAGRQAYERVESIFEFVDFSQCRRFVLVGCGMLPVTAFHVHDRTDVREILAVDAASDALAVAGQLIDRMGMRRIKTVLEDGLHFDYRGASVVFVANMVRPKSAVLSRIVDTAPNDMQLVVREPVSLGRLWTDRSQDALDPRLKVVAIGRNRFSLSQDVFMGRRDWLAQRAMALRVTSPHGAT